MEYLNERGFGQENNVHKEMVVANSEDGKTILYNVYRNKEDTHCERDG